MRDRISRARPHEENPRRRRVATDLTACEAIWNAGVDVLPLSIYSVTAPVSPALVLGFACAPTGEIPKLGRTLARAVIDRCTKSPGRGP